MGRTLLEGRKLKPDFKIKCDKLRHALEEREMINMKEIQVLLGFRNSNNTWSFLGEATYVLPIYEDDTTWPISIGLLKKDGGR